MNNNIPVLFFMVGLPASGKSTYAKELSKDYNAIICSSDEIRKELCEMKIHRIKIMKCLLYYIDVLKNI